MFSHSVRRLAPLLLALAASGCGLFRDEPKTPTVGERLSVLAFDTRPEADPALAGVEVSVPLPQANADWAQPGGGAVKASGNLVFDGTPALAWDARIAGSSKTRRLSSIPVVEAGRVFVIDTDGVVYGFDMASGRALWRAQIRLEGERTRAAFGGGVSAGNGRVYALTGFGIAAAFDAETGKELWRLEVGAPLRGAPAVTQDRVYALSQDNQLFAINAATGELDWSVAATLEAAGLLGAATPVIAGSTLVAGFSSGELVAYLTANGRTVWQDALARTGRTTSIAALADIDATPVVDRDRVFAIGHGGRMVSLELTSGQRVWERNFAGLSMPWVAGDYVYAVTLQAEVVAVTRADGRIRWVRQLPQYRDPEDKKGEFRWFGPVMASGKLWLTGSHGRLGWIDPVSGQFGDSWPVPDSVYLPPVIASGMIFVLTDSGRLLAFRGA